MVKSSNQMKNMIEDWIKIIGIKYENSTQKVQSQHPQVEWQFLIGEALHVTKMSGRNDRTDIHYAIGFPDQVKNVFNVSEKSSIELLHEINGFLTSLGLSYNWIIENNHVTGLDIRTYVDEEELNRPTFYRIWDKVTSTSNHVMKTIMLRLGQQSPVVTKMTDTSGKDMYH